MKKQTKEDKMLNLTWILGILVSTIVFGTLIGMTLNYSNISKKYSNVTVIVLSAAILVSTYLISLYKNLAYYINQYNTEISLTIAFLMLLIGFYLIKKGKPNSEYCYAISKLVLSTILVSIFLAVISIIAILSSLFTLSIFKIGIVTAVLLMLTSVFYLTPHIIENLRKIKISLLGKFMILIGFYYLALALVVPNINSVLSSPVKPIDISLITSYMVILVIILMVYGFYRKKRQNIRTR